MISKALASKMEHKMWNTHFKKAGHYKRGGCLSKCYLPKTDRRIWCFQPPLKKLH